MKNKVYLVGAGPGRHDLITVRGLKILKEADVVIYDYLVGKALLDNANEGAELICHRGGAASGLLIKKAMEGRRVVRLKNGDPSIFGRFSQEVEALARAGIEFEIVPGVTAASAASAFSGIPLTDRRYASSCIFIAGREDPKKKKSLIDWEGAVKAGTVVLYMAVDNLAKIVKQLLAAGKDKRTPVAVVTDAGLSSQKTLTAALRDVVSRAKNNQLKPPAIVIIGEVARRKEKLNWFKRNKRSLFTGLSKERFFTNGTYFHLPLIKIKPLDDYGEFDRCLRKIENFDWLVFTSRYGVEYFFKRLNALNRDSRSLAGVKIAAIGSSTSRRLLDFGVLADLIPENESSQGLIKEFTGIELKNKRVFLPRSDLSDKGLGNALRRLGAKVFTSFAYRNEFPENLPDLDLSSFDKIVFTSPSGARNFKKRYGKLPKGIRVDCIGEVTLREVKKCGLSG